MRTRAWDIRLFIVLLLVVFAVNAYASGDDIRVTQSNDMNNQTAGDLNLEGSSYSGGDAFAFAHALGDVDINDCLASTQWGTIIVSRQKVVLNMWCAAEVYDAKGMYQMAAIMRCNLDEILNEFDNEADCERANLYTPPPTPIPLDDTPEPSVFEELYEQEQMHDEQLAQLLDRVEQIEQRPEPRPRPPQTVIQQQEYIDDDKRERLRQLLDEDEE